MLRSTNRSNSGSSRPKPTRMTEGKQAAEHRIDAVHGPSGPSRVVVDRLVRPVPCAGDDVPTAVGIHTGVGSVKVGVVGGTDDSRILPRVAGVGGGGAVGAKIGGIGEAVLDQPGIVGVGVGRGDPGRERKGVADAGRVVRDDPELLAAEAEAPQLAAGRGGVLQRADPRQPRCRG